MRFKTIAFGLILLLSPLASAADIAGKSWELHEKWNGRFAQEGFTSVVAPPFVIAGDSAPERIANYRDHTILAAAKALRANFFNAEPSEPVLILLFETSGSYRRLAKKWFDYEDIPHYGFFRSDNIMLMNVGTGTGTLVHELTHALIRPDFPKVPDWFNEGFASLFEQCSLGDNSIHGLPNWRLAGLQRAIKADQLRPLREMIKDSDFRNEERVGLNYAHARYLLLYLQEKELLRDYYRRFRAAVDNDQTGLETLEHLIAPQKLEDFERDWRAWTLQLKFN